MGQCMLSRVGNTVDGLLIAPTNCICLDITKRNACRCSLTRHELRGVGARVGSTVMARTFVSRCSGV